MNRERVARAALAAIACTSMACGSQRAPDAPKNSKKEPAMTTTAGKTIEFYEDDKLIDTDDFATVPENIRFVTVNGAKVAVAKVIARTAGDQRFIEQYSADGVLLRRTMQVRDPH